MNCSKTREFLKSGERPDELTLGHIRSCGECARVADREERLSGLLKQVPAVEPPSDFDRVLMNKIENRRRSGSSARFLRPGILVPVSAAALLLAVLAIAFALFQDRTSPEIAGPGDENAPVESSPGSNQPPETESEDAPSPDELAGPVLNASPENVEEPRANDGTEKPFESDEEPFEGGSRDLGAETPETTVPPWAAGTPKIDPGQTPARKFSPGELLSEIGIESRFEKGGWRVISVRSGSIGARAGVKNGDLIKALDGRALTDAPIAGGGKKLLVVRSGREMILSIRP